MLNETNTTYPDFNYYFYYDETSPTCLRWKVTIYSGRCFNQINVIKDSVAGYLVSLPNGSRGYSDVRCKHKTYKINRVIWTLFYGEIPDNMVIDHIDGDPWNNNILNLCCKTKAGNSQNRKKPKTNTSGVVGVHWLFKNNKKTRVMVRWVDKNSVRHSKSFSVNVYGEENAFNLATEYRNLMILEMNKNGTNYTKRHGS